MLKNKRLAPPALPVDVTQAKKTKPLIRSVRNMIEECNSTIAGLREQVEYLTKKLFGMSSEKSRNIEGQLNLFNEAEQETCPADGIQETETIIIKEHTRKAKRTGEETFKGVPSKDVVVPLSEGQRYCEGCGSEIEVIEKEFVHMEFRFAPAKGEVS